MAVSKRALIALGVIGSAGLIAALLSEPRPDHVPGSDDVSAPPVLSAGGPSSSLGAGGLVPAAPRATPAAPSTGAPDAEADFEPSPGVNLAPGPVHVVTAVIDGRHLEVADGELLVAFRDPGDADVMRAVHDRFGTQVVQRSAHHDVRRVLIEEGEDLAATLARVRRDPAVAWASANAVSRGAWFFDNDGPPNLYYKQWPHRLVGWSSAQSHEDYDFSDVVVAVIDSGVAYEDYVDPATGAVYARVPDLSPAHFVAGYDFVNDDAHPNDDHQHGTHIASIISSDYDESPAHVEGYAPNARIMPIKALDADLVGTEMTLVEGIYWAVDHGADMLNMSLGFGLDYPGSQLMRDALGYAEAHGVVMIASAGNVPVPQVTWPAASPAVLAVGASCPERLSWFRWDERRCEYSAYGTGVDLLAHGGSLATDANWDGTPDGIIGMTFDLNDPTSFGYFAVAGTSQAAASVTGLAALQLSVGVPASEVPALVRNRSFYLTTDSGVDYAIDDGGGYVDPVATTSTGVDGQAEAAQPPAVMADAVVALERGDDGELYGVAAVQVVDGGGRPLVGVDFWGSWSGASDETSKCTTDAHGICLVRSARGAPASEPVLFGLSLDRVKVDAFPKPFRPQRYFRLAVADAQEVTAHAAAVAQDWFLLTLVDDASPDAQAVFDSADLEASYYLRSYGAGLASSSMVATFNQPWFDLHLGMETEGVLSGLGLASSSIILDFDATRFFDPVWHVDLVQGLGLASSSYVSPIIIREDALYSVQEPVFWTTWGNGLASSSYVFVPSVMSVSGVDFMALPIMGLNEEATLVAGQHLGPGVRVD